MNQTVNPYTGELVEEFEQHSADVVERKLFHAVEAQVGWASRSFDERAENFRRAADILEDRAQDYAEIMTLEMGKTLSSAKSEVEKCAWVCRYFADNAADFLADEPIETDGSRSWVQFQPLGVLLAIMPWNYPFWQLFRAAAPALMAGNVAILKHASNVPQCSAKIVEVFRDAGFPEGVFEHVYLGNDETEELIADDRIAAVTLTGSVRAGRAVGAAAGRALKPAVLELGGSDPFIVLDDADVESAVDGAVKGRMQNNGQSCIAAKRFIVEEGIYDTFLRHFAERLEGLVLGDPTDDATDLGPMAREDLRDDLHDQVKRSIEAGAVLRLGGEVPKTPGWFYPATLLTDVTPGVPVFDEETFGPVVSVTKARDLDHALELARTSDFGLGGSVWTERAEVDAIIDRIESGCVAVNGIVKSDPRLPFGGIKRSGFGRELSVFGIREFVNVKSVWVA